MAFKRPSPVTSVPDSPERLFLDLPDVALQLPTGNGKTFVGLFIAEWRRRKNEERIVYCRVDETAVAGLIPPFPNPSER